MTVSVAIDRTATIDRTAVPDPVARGTHTGSRVPRQRSAGQSRAAEHASRDGRGTVLLTRLYELPADHPDRPRLRDRAIEWYLPLAGHLARRFFRRGEQSDDLVQVATVGLIKAVDGYNPARGVEFTSYAVPTIVGELKRHFRDHGWSVRVPRRLQELKLAIGNATGPLGQRLGRSPTVADLAEHLDVSTDDVIEGMSTSQAYAAMSLSAPVGTVEDGELQLQDLLGADDPELATVDDRATLRPLLDQLPDRQRRIVVLRFFGNLTQSQIAERIGVSQMHVSRLLARSLTTLRQNLATAA